MNSRFTLSLLFAAGLCVVVVAADAIALGLAKVSVALCGYETPGLVSFVILSAVVFAAVDAWADCP